MSRSRFMGQIGASEKVISSSRIAGAATVNVTAGDVVLIRIAYTSTGAVAVSLPAISSCADNRRYRFVDVDGNAGVNNITFNPNGADKIAGDSNYVMDGDDDSVEIVANKSTNNWELF